VGVDSGGEVRFTAALPVDDSVNLGSAATIRVKQVAIGLQDAKPFLDVDGALDVKRFADVTVDFSQMKIFPNGKLDFPGGWLDLGNQATWSVAGIDFRIRKIGLSADGDRRWLGLRRLQLLGEPPIQVSRWEVTSNGMAGHPDAPRLKIRGRGLDEDREGVRGHRELVFHDGPGESGPPTLRRAERHPDPDQKDPARCG
jgi:hypothetical protein